MELRASAELDGTGTGNRGAEANVFSVLLFRNINRVFSCNEMFDLMNKEN